MINIKEIQELVDYALSAPNKADAKPYIKRLEGILSRADFNSEIEPHTCYAFSKLIVSVKRASGQVADKYRLMAFVDQDLYKLKMHLDRGKR